YRSIVEVFPSMTEPDLSEFQRCPVSLAAKENQAHAISKDQSIPVLLPSALASVGYCAPTLFWHKPRGLGYPDCPSKLGVPSKSVKFGRQLGPVGLSLMPRPIHQATGKQATAD